MEKNLDIKLTSFLRAKAAEAERAIHYRPNFFLGMLENDGGHLTVMKLLSATSVSEGFKKLWDDYMCDDHEHQADQLGEETVIVKLSCFSTSKNSTL